MPESLRKTNIVSVLSYLTLSLNYGYERVLNICLYDCVPPKFIPWKLISNGMVLVGGARGRCIGHEGGAPVSGISALMEAAHGTCEPESGLSPDSESTDALTLDFPASGTMRNVFLLFIKKICLENAKGTFFFFFFLNQPHRDGCF